jgi:exodeoxyribonuclease-3
VTLTVATINVNGLRAAVRRGMPAWVAEHRPDVMSLQEVRAPDDIVGPLLGDGWAHVTCASEAKGRAGVAVAARESVSDTTDAIAGGRYAGQGRWIEGTIDTSDGRGLCVASAYVHTGQADDPDRMEEKLTFLDAIVERIAAVAATGRHVLLTGDLNVAHDERDIKNWKGNRGKAGFLPEEQARLDRLRDLGWVDLGRRFGGDGAGPYTWWSWRGKAYDTDAGWRIDYLIASSDLAELAKDVTVHRAPTYAERWSDHAPVVATFDL